VLMKDFKFHNNYFTTRKINFRN